MATLDAALTASATVNAPALYVPVFPDGIQLVQAALTASAIVTVKWSQVMTAAGTASATVSPPVLTTGINLAAALTASAVVEGSIYAGFWNVSATAGATVAASLWNGFWVALGTARAVVTANLINEIRLVSAARAQADVVAYISGTLTPIRPTGLTATATGFAWLYVPSSDPNLTDLLTSDLAFRSLTAQLIATRV